MEAICGQENMKNLIIGTAASTASTGNPLQKQEKALRVRHGDTHHLRWSDEEQFLVVFPNF